MLTDLKPCPFCGAQPEDPDVGDYFVECPRCGVQGPITNKDGQPHAKEEWNRRAIEAEVLQAQEPATSELISSTLAAITFYGSQKWAEGKGVISDPSLLNVRQAWDKVYAAIQKLAAPQPPAPCPKCDELECELVVQKGMLKIARHDRDALQAKVAYYEAQTCLPDGAFVAIPSGYTAQVAARSVSPERVADVLTQRDELRAEAERIAELEAQNDELCRKYQEHAGAKYALQDTLKEKAALIEKCEKALKRFRSDFSSCIGDEALAAIAAQRGIL